MDRLFVAMPASARDARRYVLDFVLTERLGVEYVVVSPATVGWVELRASADPVSPAVRIPDVLLDRWKVGERLPESVLNVTWYTDGEVRRTLGEDRVPLVFDAAHDDGEARFIARSPSGLDVPLDVVGAVFFWLSRWEEVAATHVDDMGRFDEAGSHAVVHGYRDRPVVDEYTAILGHALAELFPALPPPTPGLGRTVLTHDVDSPRISRQYPTIHGQFRAALGDMVKRRSPRRSAVRVSCTLADRTANRLGSDPFDNFRSLNVD